VSVRVSVGGQASTSCSCSHHSSLRQRRVAPPPQHHLVRPLPHGVVPPALRRGGAHVRPEDPSRHPAPPRGARLRRAEHHPDQVQGGRDGLGARTERVPDDAPEGALRDEARPPRPRHRREPVRVPEPVPGRRHHLHEGETLAHQLVRDAEAEGVEGRLRRHPQGAQPADSVAQQGKPGGWRRRNASSVGVAGVVAALADDRGVGQGVRRDEVQVVDHRLAKRPQGRPPRRARPPEGVDLAGQERHHPRQSAQIAHDGHVSSLPRENAFRD
jgi:hypothetical protein